MNYSSTDELPENREDFVVVRAIISNIEFVDNSKDDEAIVLIKELKSVFDKIIEEIKHEKEGRIKIGDFADGFAKLIQYFDRFEGNIILINTSDKYYFKDNMEDNFHPSQNKDIYYGSLDLCNRKIPVFASELVPKGTMLLFDNTKIGTISIEKKVPNNSGNKLYKIVPSGLDSENSNAAIMFRI